MKSNFEEMTNAELRDYALKHRFHDDVDALRVLFSRRKLDSETIVFYPPKSEEEQELFELFKRILEEKANKNSQT